MDFLRKLTGRKPRRKVFEPHELPTIIVETPQGYQMSIGEMSDDVLDEDDKLMPLRMADSSDRQRFRRNSISLPNLDDLEEQVFRIEGEDVPVPNRFSSTESSDDDFTFDFDEMDKKRMVLATT